MLTPREADQLDRWLTTPPDDDEQDPDTVPDDLEDLGDDW